MRAIKRTKARGFTLVELMIVVAIIGVLAALAIYGVRRYLASAKTAEAKEKVGAISRAAFQAYERETANAESLAEGESSEQTSHILCGSAEDVPDTVPVGTKYQPDTTDGEDYQTGDYQTGWKCLGFSIDQPHYYQYHYVDESGTPCDQGPQIGTDKGFQACANGDLNGDAETSTFTLMGEVTDTGKLKTSTSVAIHEEFE